MKYIFDRITIYPKLVLTFLLVLIPLFLLSLIMNEYGSNNVKSEITNSMQSKVHFYNSALESDFTRIIQLMKEFASYDDLDLLSNRSEILGHYEQLESIRKLQKELSVIKNASNYVKSAKVLIPSIDRSISDNSIGSIPKDEFDALNVVTNIYESPFIYWNDRLFISLPYPIQLNNLAPQFVVDIEISQDLLQNALLQFTDQTIGSTMLVNLQKNWRITASSKEDSLDEPIYKKEIKGVPKGLKSIRIENQTYLVAFEKSKILGTTLVMYELEQNVLGPLYQFKVWFWMISALSFIVIILVSYFVYRLIHQPLKNLVRAFRKVEHGNLDLTLDYRGKDEFQYLYTQFNAMVRNLQQMIYEVYEQKYRVQHAELKQLQSQINPHFLYNSLFILYRLAKKNRDEKQIKFTKYLSDYFQFMTYNSSDEVLLGEEVQHAKNYVEIQMMRFADQIEVSFEELPIFYAQVKVPRLILQPIVENAYKHGLEHRISGGKLQVSFLAQDDSLLIMVEDTGRAVDEAALKSLQRKLENTDVTQETTGLINVHRRLSFRFGAGFGLSVSKGALDGFKVTLRLPSP